MCKNFTIAFMAITASLTANHAHAEPSARPDIVFLLADDMGAHLGCYGDPFAKTPTMDRIAKEGVRFDNAWVTQASCSPSRSSILTGLYPHQNGQVGLAHLGFSMSGEFDSIPSLLNGAGYYTALIGKLHVRPTSSFPFNYLIEPGKFDPRDAAQYRTHIKKVIDQAGDKPLFLELGLTDPHRPFQLNHKGLPKAPVTSETVKMLSFMEGLDKVADLISQVAGYYNGIMRVDGIFSEALKELEQRGRLDNTIFVIMGDHGAPFGRGKVTCYHPGLRVPYIVKWPGVSKAGIASKSLVSSVDLLPTFLDAAGTSAPAALAGKSLRPVLANPEAKIRDHMVGEFTSHLPTDYFPRRTIRDSRYQLIVNYLSPEPNPTTGIEGEAERDSVKQANTPAREPSLSAVKEYMAPPRLELFDLENDADNFHNLADKPEHADKIKELQAALEQWQKATKDPLLSETGYLDKMRKISLETKRPGQQGQTEDGKKPGKKKRKAQPKSE